MRIIQFADPDGLLEYGVWQMLMVPVWETENRGWTHEEAEEFKEEVAWLGRERAASDLRL